MESVYVRGLEKKLTVKAIVTTVTLTAVLLAWLGRSINATSAKTP